MRSSVTRRYPNRRLPDNLSYTINRPTPSGGQDSKVYINGIEGFWSYAKQLLIKHHGISPSRFPLYLKEWEFRYNNRHHNTFDIIIQYLCDLVPNYD